MSLSINTKTYTADSFDKNRVIYAGPSNTVTVKDTFNLSRVAPKPTKDFAGVARSSGKLTRTLTVTNGGVSSAADGIVDFQTSIPVGAAAADIDAFLNDLGAFIASATYKTIVKNAQISF